MQDELRLFIPFEKLRGRTLVLCFLITSFVGGIFPEAVMGLFFYVTFFLVISPILFRSGLSYKLLFGPCPKFSTFRRYIIWVIPLFIFSIVVIYLQYVLLHYLVPEIADGWFFDSSPSFVPPDSHEELFLTNVLESFTIVLIAPVVEEFFVRGILLTRWSIKWGTPQAILMSSFLFGILHADIIGAFFFGYVLSILYIRTKSLLIPISIHMANNLIASAIAFVPTPIQEVPQHETHFVLQESEAISLMVLAVIIISWAINIVWKNVPKESWRVPYLADAKFLK